MMLYSLFIVCVFAGQAAVAEQGIGDASILMQQKVDSALNSKAKQQSAMLAKTAERMLSQAYDSVWKALDKPHKRRPLNHNAPTRAEAAKLFKEGSEYILDSVGNFTEVAKAKLNKANETHGKNVVLVQHSWRVIALLAAEIAQIFDTIMTGRQCFFTNSLLFFVLGGICLVREEHLSPSDAVVVLFQQMTTVGYGSSTPGNNTEREYTDVELRVWKLFHGLHAWFGNLLVNGPMVDAWKATIQNMEFLLIKKFSVSRSMLKGLETVLAILVWSGIYAIDQGTFTDGLYLTLMTMSTVGYGDISPSKEWAKWVSPFFMIWGTHTYGELTNQLQGSFEALSKDWSDDKNVMEQIWETWKHGLGKWYSDCWESNKDVTITFGFKHTPDKECSDLIIPRKIVTALSHGWKLPLGLDISVLPINKARLEGKKCVFHMRLNNVPWQKVDSIIKDKMGLQDKEDMPKVNSHIREVYRSTLGSQPPESPPECIQPGPGEDFPCLQAVKVQVHNLHMPLESE